MKNQIKNIIIVVIYLIIVIVLFKTITIIKSKKQENENSWKDDSIMYKQNISIDDLKQEYKITGDNNLYEINTEYDGRKVLNIKSNINYKVAFSGIIKKQMPNFDEIETIYNNYYPKDKKGIWIEEKSRDKIINYLNTTQLLSYKYNVDDSGFIIITNKDNSSKYDKILEDIINSNNTYILSITGIYYMVDIVTGEIIKNPYEDLEPDQPYEYIQNNNDLIICITENIKEELSSNEIFENIIELIKQ